MSFHGKHPSSSRQQHHGLLFATICIILLLHTKITTVEAFTITTTKLKCTTSASNDLRNLSSQSSSTTTVPTVGRTTYPSLNNNNNSRRSVNYSPKYELSMSSNNNNEKEYSVEIRLREEAESPFRKVRFLVYAALLGGALTSLAVSTARIAAALAGVNTDLMDQSLTNAIVDLSGIVVIGYLFKRDVDAQESRLKRAAKGADFAKLAIRGSSSLLEGAAENASLTSKSGRSTVSVPLSSLRRGRGVDKRVVIAAGGRDKISEVLKEAQDLGDDILSLNDLVIVPVVLPQCTAPLGLDVELIEQENILLPAGGNWRSVLGDEAEDAVNQGVDVEKEGFCIVLKKNGRVGQRTRGIYLSRMCGEVTERREMGLDVKNI